MISAVHMPPWKRLLTASLLPRLGQVYCLFDNEEVEGGLGRGL